MEKEEIVFLDNFKITFYFEGIDNEFLSNQVITIAKNKKLYEFSITFKLELLDGKLKLLKELKKFKDPIGKVRVDLRDLSNEIFFSRIYNNVFTKDYDHSDMFNYLSYVNEESLHKIKVLFGYDTHEDIYA